MDYDTSAVGSGFIVPQALAAFDGDYAVNLQFVGADGENDWVGEAVAASGALTGTVDINDSGLTSAGVAMGGTYTADAANAGRWTGGFTVNSIAHLIRYYQVSGTLVLIVDTDTADVGIGILEKME